MARGRRKQDTKIYSPTQGPLQQRVGSTSFGAKEFSESTRNCEFPLHFIYLTDTPQNSRYLRVSTPLPFPPLLDNLPSLFHPANLERIKHNGNVSPTIPLRLLHRHSQFTTATSPGIRLSPAPSATHTASSEASQSGSPVSPRPENPRSRLPSSSTFSTSVWQHTVSTGITCASDSTRTWASQSRIGMRISGG